MKKFIVLLILTFVFFNSFSSVCDPCKNADEKSYLDHATTEDINNKNNWNGDYSNQLLLTFFNLLLRNNGFIFNNNGNLHEKYPIMSEQKYEKNTNNYSTLPEIKDIILPDYFSWKDYNGQDWTTPAKNQADPGYCGSCWAFAGVAALESIIEIREGNPDLNPDLSEQYLLSCLPSAGDCSGGSVETAFYYIMDISEVGNNCNGIILESCLPYQADDSVPCSEKSDDWMNYLVPIENWNQVDLGHDTSRVRDVLKYWIVENGPVSTNLYIPDNILDLFILWGSLFHGSNWFFPYFDVMDNIYNHCVIIVGWQDNPLIRRGGYWICKNSWGSEWGYDGYFNIVYGSLNIANEIQWVDYDPESYDWPPEAVCNNFNRESGDPSLKIGGYP